MIEEPCKTCGGNRCCYAIWVTYQDNTGTGLEEEYSEMQAWACSFIPRKKCSKSVCIDSRKEYRHILGYYKNGEHKCEKCKNKKPCPDCKPKQSRLGTGGQNETVSS